MSNRCTPNLSSKRSNSAFCVCMSTNVTAEFPNTSNCPSRFPSTPMASILCWCCDTQSPSCGHILLDTSASRCRIVPFEDVMESTDPTREACHLQIGHRLPVAISFHPMVSMLCWCCDTQSPSCRHILLDISASRCRIVPFEDVMESRDPTRDACRLQIGHRLPVAISFHPMMSML